MNHQHSSGSVIFSVCTKPVDQELYPAGLANAVHLAYQRPGQPPQPLNRDYGILFAKGSVSDDDTIVPAGISDPALVVLEEGLFGIRGRLVDESGSPAPCSAGDMYLWKTRDFIRFEEIGPVPAESLSRFHTADHLSVDAGVAENAIRFWSPIRFHHLVLPDRVPSFDALNQLQPEAVYSDGSRRRVRIDWNPESARSAGPDGCEIEGTVHHQVFRFPLAKGYGDPVIFPWEGKW